MAERWVAPALPTDGRLVAVLQPSLQRLERVLGRVPLVYPDRLVTADTTLVDTDELVLVDTTGGAVIVTLPVASAAQQGRRYTTKKMNAGANTVTLTPVGADTIDGGATLAWNTQYTAYTVQCVLGTAPATYVWVIV